MVNRRKGVMTNMEHRDERVHLTFNIPSRGIIGLRSNLLTATAGEAVMSHRLKGFEPYAGEIEMRTNGSLIAMETGDHSLMPSTNCKIEVDSSSTRETRFTPDR